MLLKHTCIQYMTVRSLHDWFPMKFFPHVAVDAAWIGLSARWPAQQQRHLALEDSFCFRQFNQMGEGYVHIYIYTRNIQKCLFCQHRQFDISFTTVQT